MRTRNTDNELTKIAVNIILPRGFLSGGLETRLTRAPKAGFVKIIRAIGVLRQTHVTFPVFGELIMGVQTDVLHPGFVVLNRFIR